jgi:hypothetical protein
MIWTGVLIHEMVMSFTPFAPSRCEDVTELFTNIAMVTVRVSVYVCVYVYVCVCVCKYVCVYVCMCAFIRTC